MNCSSRLSGHAAFVLAALAVSCGGSAGDGSPLMAPQAAVAQDTCFQSAGLVETGYHFVNGVCTKTFAPMYAPADIAKQTYSPQTQPVYTWPQLLAWAESTYPQYFSGSSQNGTYAEFTYRYYPATRNYLGLRTGTDMVYVTGGVTDGDLLYIGTLSALSCQVYPANCITTTPVTASAPAISQYPTVTAWATGSYSQYFSGATQDGVEDGYAYRRYATGNYVAVKSGRVYILGPATGGVLKDAGTISAPSFPSAGSTGGSTGADVPGSTSSTVRLAAGTPVPGTIDQAGDQDWYGITLVAGTAYTFDLQGASGGGGTLPDPILRLLNASGTEITSNDDINYPSNKDSRITYTPTVGGNYFLSAQAYSSQAGTFKLSATGGSGSGTSGGIVSAPAPIYSARNISLGTPLAFASSGTEFFAIQLSAGVLYSFDSGTPPLSWTNSSWGVFDANGINMNISSGGNVGNHFGWTPPSTGVYYIQPGYGTALTIRSHGTATTNAYAAGEPYWITGSLLYTFGNALTSPAFPINLHVGETYNLTFSHRASATAEVTLSSGSGQVINRATVAAAAPAPLITVPTSATMRVSAPTSDTYYLQVRQSRVVSGAKFFIGASYLTDSDGDGDPDDTDPYPSDPNRSSTTGGSGTGGTGTGGTCAPYSGPLDDPQTHTYCQAAYSYSCIGDTTNQARMCSQLTNVLSLYGVRQTAAQYCPNYCR